MMKVVAFDGLFADWFCYFIWVISGCFTNLFGLVVLVLVVVGFIIVLFDFSDVV